MQDKRALVVFCHGYLGFAKIGCIEYFRGLKDYLEKLFPDILFLFPEVSPLGTTDSRAAQLDEELYWYYDEFKGRIFLIGHSMGGLDARRLVSLKSRRSLKAHDAVNAVITIATPHRGSPVADVVHDGWERLPDSRLWRKCKKRLDNSFFQQGLRSLRTDTCAAFNDHYVDNPGIRYISFAGKTSFGFWKGNMVPPILYWAHLIVKHFEGMNDGLVSHTSAQWGEFQGVIDADHVEQVGWQLSCIDKVASWFGRSFDYLGFYRSLIDRYVLEKGGEVFAY